MTSKNISKRIEEITKNNIGQDENKIAVYEANGQTVRIQITGVDYQFSADFIQTQDSNLVEITMKKDQEDKIQTISLENTAQSTKLSIIKKEEKETKQFNIEETTQINNEKGTKNLYITVEDKDEKVEANIEQNNKIVSTFDNEVQFNEKNKIKLNTLEEGQLKQLVATMSEGVLKKWEGISEKVKVEDLKKVLKATGMMQEGQKIESSGVSETEKNRFNSQFELLKGEGLKKEDIDRIIQTTKNNLTDIEVTSNTQFKIKLEQNNHKEETVETLTAFLNKNKDRKYNVDIEYDAETGLASYIVLDIIVKR